MTKKRKATAKVAEAAPSYTARSRQLTTRTKKTAPKPKSRRQKQKVSPGEALWEYFLTLTEEDHGAFIVKMLEDEDWRDDVMDIAVMMERRNEPTTPYAEFREELKREGLSCRSVRVNSVAHRSEAYRR